MSKQQRNMNGSNMPKKNKKQKRQDPALQLRPAFPGQVVLSMKIVGTPIVVSTTALTGLVQGLSLVNINNIPAFATRFGALFEEYRFVKAKWTSRMFSSTNIGLLVYWVDEKVFGAPTLAESRTKSNMKDIISASATNIQKHLTWTPHDPLDQQYTAIGTSNTFAAFKVYGDNTNYGTSTIAASYFEIFPEFTVQFRGML